MMWSSSHQTYKYLVQALSLLLTITCIHGRHRTLYTDESPPAVSMSTHAQLVIPRRVLPPSPPTPTRPPPLRTKREFESNRPTSSNQNEGKVEFAFDAFGESFRLSMESDSDFIGPDLQVQRISRNLSTWTPVDKSSAVIGCYYKGHLVGEREDSALAISLCHGMMGHIWTPRGRFFVEPATPGGNISDFHVVYRYQRNNHTFDDVSLFNHLENKFHNNRSRIRRKRSESLDLHVEIMVVADSQMQRYHGDLLQNYILTLMSIVSLIYKDASIGNSINIAVVKLAILGDDMDQDIVHVSASKTLKSFCKWQVLQNDPDDRSPMHHDTAILLTREDICRSPKKCDTLGLAELGTMCDPYNSCSIVEDNGLSAAFTIAHELGHVLSMPHDDDIIKCRRINNGKEYHVMARMLDYNTFPWSWSTCSSHYLTEFLDAGLAQCLSDQPTRNKLHGRWAEDRQPGEIFNDDSQCELVYGAKAKICPYMPVCKLLWCMTAEVIGCRTHHMPWADGTKCGEHKWCQKGECRRKDPHRLVSVDGRWGKWNKFGSCSRSCGGGIQKASRHCNNPKPANGGRYCIGRRVRYRSCNTKSCGSSAGDFREDQCASFNGKHFNIHGLPANVSWVAVYSGINPKDRCKLFCRVSTGNAYYVLREKVIDGTPCSPDSFDVCVNGMCLPAGCDLRLGSKKRLDHCGVCGGNNSTCKTISGYLNRKLTYGYTDIVRIPAGSNNIDVRQHGYNNSEKDDNYIALKTPEDNYILNGNFSVILFKKLIQYGGSVVEYTGAGSIVERINSSKPLQKDLIIQILSVKDLLPPDIHYQYTISTTTDYRWEFLSDWGECSSSCQGERSREPVCVRVHDRQTVNNDHCWTLASKPRNQKEQCNLHCKLSWRITHKSECSAQCGIGHRTLTVQCVQVVEQDSRIVDDWYCSLLGNKPPAKEKCEVPCATPHWEYGAWSKCSKSCGGGGLRYRTARCVKDGVGVNDSRCPVEEKTITLTCGRSECPSWMTGEWFYCSVSCGVGERQRPYWCQVNGKEVHGSMCDQNSIPEHRQTCTLPDCPEWMAGHWGQCSTTCGKGLARRMVVCQSESVKVDDSQCKLRERPEEVMTCELGDCQDDLEITEKRREDDRPIASSRQEVPANRERRTWQSGSWGECSTTCGDGYRKRAVFCYDEVDDRVLDESDCRVLVRPVAIELCRQKSCGRWGTGEWSECTVTCGAGIQSRRVFCQQNGTRDPANWDCEQSERPSHEQLCAVTPCPRFVPEVTFVDDDNNAYLAVQWKAGQWGRCSRRCGNGYQRRQVVCQDETGQSTTGCDPKRKPTETAVCNTHECPSWVIGRWGACTRTCGTGLKRRRVFCKDHRGAQVNDEHCEHSVRPADEQSCNLHSCGGVASGSGHHWQTGPWTSCSVTCGEGVQERHVVCIESDGRVVPSSYCDSESVSVVQNCSMSECPSWRSESEWSECSASCGGGTQTRKSVCSYDNETVEDALCAGLPPNTETRPCNTRPCPTQWFKGSWSHCTKSCGRGRQFRPVYCVDGRGTKMDDRLCVVKDRPRTRRACNKNPCPYMWKTGYWSDCSVSCGPGVQTRTAFCHEVNPYGWMNPDPVLAGCNETERPAIIQACNYGDCGNMFHWNMGSWSQCTVLCGEGHNRRRVFCRDRSGKIVARSHCRRHSKPQRRRKCRMRPCESISCWDVQQKYEVRHDGEQEIWIRGKMVKIHCSDMNTSSPHEYVTLPTGEGENYSEMYDKRLIRPDTCPYNGARQDSCECVDDTQSRAGLTAFTKIRLNITNLRVVTHDFRFARQINGQLIPYAEAADCYSSANCPQGRFSVNMVETGLVVSEFTEWVGNGNKPAIKILQNQDGLRVQGRCGGYCGKCTVEPLVGLLLDVAPP